MNSKKSRLDNLFKKCSSTLSSPIIQPIFIISQTFVNNYPPPKNPFFPHLKEEAQFIPSEIDPSFFEEEKAFLNIKESLYEKYNEKYVAIKNGKVVDSDENSSELAERVYRKFKPPIYIDKVTTEEEITYLLSPKTDV